MAETVYDKLITFNVYKQEPTVKDMTSLFNGRVGDQGVRLAVRWVQGVPGALQTIDVIERKMYGSVHLIVGNGIPDGQGDINMDVDASGIDIDSDPANNLPYGITVFKLPQEAFPKDGFAKGYFALKDELGNVWSSIDVWFKVKGGTPYLAAKVKYFSDEWNTFIAMARKQNEDFANEMRDNYNQQVTEAQNAFIESTKDLRHLGVTAGSILSQIDAKNIVTVKQHVEDIQKVSGEIDKRFDNMHQEVETFADLDAVKAKYPDGGEGIFVLDDGYRAVYRNNQWVRGPIYQAMGIANDSVKTVHTDFARHRHNIYNQDEALTGIYNAVSGKVVYQGTTSSKHYGDFTCFKFKIGDQHTFTVPGTDFNVLGSTDDGTIAWSDNQNNGVAGSYTFAVPTSVVWVYVTFLTDNYDTYYCFAGGLDYDSTGQFLLNAPLASPLAKEVVTPEMTTFVLGKGNLYNDSAARTGIYNVSGNTIVYQDKSVNQHFGEFTCFKFKTNGQRTFTVSGTDFTTFASLEDGTLAWADNHNDGVTGPYTFTVPANVVWVYVTFKPSTYASFKAVTGSDLAAVGYRLADNIEVPAISNGKNRLDVGKNYHFTTLIDAVNEAKAHASHTSPYTIYIHDDSTDCTGTTYDLFQELGGITYLSTIESASDNMQGLHIPAYVSLVGIGKVTLLAELPDSTSFNQSANFSTIELEQGNNRLENLTIKIRNGRYAVHDESRDKYPNAYHIFKNVTFIHEGNVSGLWQAPHAYAAGTSGGSRYSYTNCIFDATKSGGYPFDLHNYAPQEGVTVETDGIQLLPKEDQKYVMRFGFNGYSPVTNDQVKYAACFNDVFLKNVLGIGSVLVEPEDSSYNCTNNYRIHNFTNLNLDIKNNQIKA